MSDQDWETAIAENSEVFSREFGKLNGSQLNWKPDPKTWSVGQVLEHLLKTSQSYEPIIAKLLDGSYRTPLMGKITPAVNFFGKMILGAVQPEAQRKTRTFPVWEPAQSAVQDGILADFLDSQEVVKNQIKACRQAGLLACVVGSPASGMVVYKLSTAFDILVAHQRRHFLQAQRILAAQPDG